MRKFILCLFLTLPVVAFAKKYNAEVVSTNTSITVQENTLIRKVNCAIKINNSDGDKYTRIVISYNKGDVFSHLEARIVDKNGKIVRKLKKKDVNEEYGQGRNALFMDTYHKSFRLDYYEYPYTLVYSYQIQSENRIQIAGWNPLHSWKIPTKEATLTIKLPLDYKISFHDWKVDTLIKQTIGTEKEYSWKAHYTKILEPEAYAPPLITQIPKVIVVALHFNYGEPGSTKSWKDFGNWHYSVNQNLDILPAKQKQRIDSLLKGVKGKTDKIRILYHYLQDETQYVSVQIKTGRRIPFPASFVANNKYGDCKALANYMKAMLKYAGIKSYYTVIRGGNHIIKVDTNFVSTYPFNHAILYVPDSTRPLWLDCTSKLAFGYVGPFIQRRYAMVVQKNHTRLIRTPELTPNQVEDFSKIEVSCKVDGEAFLKFHNIYRGNKYKWINYLVNRSNPMFIHREIREHLVNYGINMISDSIHQINRDSTYIQLFYTGRSGRIYRQYGNHVLVTDIPFGVPDVENPRDREFPVQIDYPIYKVDSIRYEIPSGYKLVAAMKDTILKTQFGKYSHSFHKKGQSVFVTNELLINAGTYPLKVYGKFYQFLKDVGRKEHSMVFELARKNFK